jgi:hypothetical protein
MGVFHQVGRSADNYVHSINAGLNSNSGIIHVTSDVCENLHRSVIAVSRGSEVPTLAFNPSLQIASQSALDCSDAAGEVSSILINVSAKY